MSYDQIEKFEAELKGHLTIKQISFSEKSDDGLREKSLLKKKNKKLFRGAHH